MGSGPPSDSKKMYCRHCWREEHFRPHKIGPFLAWLPVFLTLGISLLFWPFRCVTCGRKRYANRLILKPRSSSSARQRITDDQAC